MSVTFLAADSEGRRKFRCDCLERGSDIMDENPDVDIADLDLPSCRVCRELEMNVANINASELLAWIGYENIDLWGEDAQIPAREVAARCQRRLWAEERNYDRGYTSEENRDRVLGLEALADMALSYKRVHFGNRRPGYLREQTERLLKIAKEAEDGYVVWS